MLAKVHKNAKKKKKKKKKNDPRRNHFCSLVDPRLNERLFFLSGFLSLSSSKLIAVQPSNMLTASHVEYPMLPGKPTYESTADTQQSQGET